MTSIVANGYGLNSFGDGDSDDYLVAQGWSCDPIFHEEKIVNWEYESKDQLAENLLEFRGCKGQGISTHVRDAFINAYVTIDYRFGFGFVDHSYKPRFKTMVSVAEYEMQRGAGQLNIRSH
jgi:hypothetical protein